MSDKKLDIFEVLKNFDQCNLEYVKGLSDEEYKSLYPLVLMRWMSGTRDTSQIVRINAIVNPFVFNLYKEKGLIVRLLLSSSLSKKTYKWHSRKKEEKIAMRTELIRKYYGCTKKEAGIFQAGTSVEDLIAMAEELAYDNEFIKKIK